MPAPNINSHSPVTILNSPTVGLNSILSLITASLSTTSGTQSIYTLKWGDHGIGSGATIYYSFPTTNANWLWSDGYVQNINSEIYGNFTPLSNAQKSAAISAFEKWSNVANINLIEVANETSNGVGDIRIANTDGGSMTPFHYAYAYLPFRSPMSGDIWFNTTQPVSTANNYNVGATGYATMLHEIGHTLGLSHPFKEEGDHPSKPVLSTAFDHHQYTIMSYSSSAGMRDDGLRDFYPTTPMLYDIQAIQYLYGANMAYNTGDNVYTYGDNYTYETIWDAGGLDTIEYNGQYSAIVNLNAGEFSSIGPTFNKNGPTNPTNPIPTDDGIPFTYNDRDFIRGSIANLSNPTSSHSAPHEPDSHDDDDHPALNGNEAPFSNLGIAYNVTIENAITSSGNDIIYGNGSNNRVDGRGGNDTFVISANQSDVTNIVEIDATTTIIYTSNDTDTLINIEEISFADSMISISELINEQSIKTPSFEIIVNGASQINNAEAYTGPVNFLQYQAMGSSNNEIIIGSATNDFINLLDGHDAADGGAGDDVLDGGTGSNFLTGGLGADVFFIDGRGGQITWSTITDFHEDKVNIWGWEDGISRVLVQSESDGAAGYKGATLHMDLNADNEIDTSVTFSGLSISEIGNRQSLSVADNGYLYIS